MPYRLAEGILVKVVSAASRERADGVFRITGTAKGFVRAVHLDGSPVKEFYPGDAVRVVLEEGGANLIYDAAVAGVDPPDGIAFRVKGEPKEGGLREYARIDDYLCLEYAVRRGEKKAVAEAFRQRMPRKPPIQLTPPSWFTVKDDRNILAEVEKEILKVLSAMDTKIDAIVKCLAEGDRSSLMSFTPRWVNLSGAGMRFVVADGVSAGDFLEIKIFLPDAGGVPVAVLGEVIRAEPTRRAKESGLEAAVAFRCIEEEDRDRLIRYIFARQREAIRSGAERKGGERSVV
jgi:hypothetical protein